MLGTYIEGGLNLINLNTRVIRRFVRLQAYAYEDPSVYWKCIVRAHDDQAVTAI